MRSSLSFIGLLAVGGFSAALCTSCSREPAAGVADAPTYKIEGTKIAFVANAPQLTFLKTEPATERKAMSTGLTGRLAWDDDVTAKFYAPVSGRIAQIVAQPGQTVTVGDTLAKVLSPDFGQAQADARKASVDLQRAERALRRTRELLENRAAAAKDVESAEADEARAVSESERASALLSLYGGNRSGGVDGLYSLKSSVAGVVVDRTVSPGQEVRADQIGDKPLFVISDPARLWLFLDVTPTEATSLRTGQDVLVRVRSLPDKTFHGHVQVIGEGLDPATRTIKARCEVDNAEKLLRAEMYVDADLAANAGSGVVVPTKAIFLKNNQSCIFVEARSGVFTQRIVKVGSEDNSHSVILEGLSIGDHVVVDGALLLQSILEGENS